MTEAQIIKGRQFSTLWALPLAAILIGGWMIWFHYSSLGPKITIQFESAAGLEAGKTLVKYRDVIIGNVTDVELSKDLKSVQVTLQIKAEDKQLIRDDSHFWVVRPRVSAAGVSGLGTLLSGAYIEISPGTNALTKKRLLGTKHPR